MPMRSLTEPSAPKRILEASDRARKAVVRPSADPLLSGFETHSTEAIRHFQYFHRRESLAEYASCLLSLHRSPVWFPWRDPLEIVFGNTPWQRSPRLTVLGASGCGLTTAFAAEAMLRGLTMRPHSTLLASPSPCHAAALHEKLRDFAKCKGSKGLLHVQRGDRGRIKHREIVGGGSISVGALALNTIGKPGDYDRLVLDDAQLADPDVITSQLSFQYPDEWGTLNGPSLLLGGQGMFADDLLGAEWSASSQTVWCIACERCGQRNVASVEHQLEDMIGEDGLQCAFCKSELRTRNGLFVHSYPDRAETRLGVCIPKVVLSAMAHDPDGWRQVIEARKRLTRTEFTSRFCAAPKPAWDMTFAADASSTLCVRHKNGDAHPNDLEPARRLLEEDGHMGLTMVVVDPRRRPFETEAFGLLKDKPRKVALALLAVPRDNRLATHVLYYNDWHECEVFGRLPDVRSLMGVEHTVLVRPRDAAGGLVRLHDQVGFDHTLSFSEGEGGHRDRELYGPQSFFQADHSLLLFRLIEANKRGAIFWPREAGGWSVSHILNGYRLVGIPVNERSKTHRATRRFGRPDAIMDAIAVGLAWLNRRFERHAELEMKDMQTVFFEEPSSCLRRLEERPPWPSNSPFTPPGR